MSIEASGPVAAPRAFEKSGSTAAKASSVGSDDADATGASSFLSLLSAMEPDAAPTVDADAAAVAAQDATLAALRLPDAAALLAQHPGRGTGPAQADMALVSGEGGPAGAPGQMAAVAGLTDQGEAAVSGGRATRGLNKFAGKADAARAAGKPADGGAGAELAADEPADAALAGTVQHASNTQSVPRRADADRSAQEAGGAQATGGAEARASESRAAAETIHADWRSTLNAQIGGAEATAPMLDALGALAKGTLGARGTERSATRPLFVPAGSALTGSWAEQALSGGNAASTTPTFAPQATVPVPEAAVAEKLNYWIARGVQNAELQLDAFGGGSVKVNIAVQGNEAQVEFRSDQPEARRLLQDAMPQLRDMLRGEGMELSGGFVGTSARQDQGTPERRNYPQGVRSAIVGVDARPGPATPALSRTPGRTVDLFV